MKFTRKKWIFKFLKLISVILIVYSSWLLIKNITVSSKNIDKLQLFYSTNFTSNGTDHNLKQFANKANQIQEIRNKHFIIDLLEEELLLNNQSLYKVPKFFIVLIQVHSRLNYLNVLIQSLKETKHIQDTLVIFSHDFIDEKINELIKSIDFCAVI